MDFLSHRRRTNPYTRWVKGKPGLAWNVSTLAESATTPWANSYTTLTWNSYLGGYPITVPSGLSGGEWTCLIYDNATPADTDEALPESRYVQVNSAGGVAAGRFLSSI